MRPRLAFVPVVLAAASLVACSSSSKSNNNSTANTSAGSSSSSSSLPASSGAGSGGASSGGTGGGSAAAFCADLQSLPAKMQEITAKAGDPSALKTILGGEAAYLAKLKADAPSTIASVIADLESMFTEAQTALSGASPDVSKLQALATKLPEDAQKLQEYATANCKG